MSKREITSDITEEIAKRQDRKVDELTPIGSVMNADALNALYHDKTPMHIEFPYENTWVTIQERAIYIDGRRISG